MLTPLFNNTTSCEENGLYSGVVLVLSWDKEEIIERDFKMLLVIGKWSNFFKARISSDTSNYQQPLP